MRSSLFFVVIIVVALSQVSCGRRFVEMSRASKKVDRKEMPVAQYDSIYNSYYQINKLNFRHDSRIKLEGSYICTAYGAISQKYDYRSIKFTDSCEVFCSIPFYDPLSNETLSATKGFTERYTTEGNELKIESLLTRDYHIYNIFQYATISELGDTLTFYRSENMQRPGGKTGYLTKEIYIYHPELTVMPRLKGKIF